MGQSPSRHRPLSSSSTHIAHPDSHPQQHPLPPTDSSHHTTDLHNQVPLPPKSTNRRSFLPTLRSPLCTRSTSHNQDDIDSSSKAHKRWTLYRRRKSTKPSRTLPDRQQPDEPQPGEPSASSPTLSSPNATPDPKGKAKQDNPTASAIELATTSSSAGPSSSDSSSSTTNVSQSDSVPFEGSLADVSSSATPPSHSTPRDPVALNHDPAPLPTQPDGSPPEQSRDDSDAFNVMERPATPPDPSQPPPPEPRRNFPAAGTLVVVQGVVHTSDVSQTGNTEPSETTPRRASSVPPPGERPSRQRFSDMFSRPVRSRRSSYAAPESQSSETSASTESEAQGEPSSTTETSPEPPAQEEPPIPTSRPLSLSPTSIDVLGTLLSVATAATAASLVSGSTDPLMTSGLALPSIQSSQQQPTPPPASDQPRSQSPTQSRTQVQSRPLSPTPTAGLGPRDRVRHALAGLRDRFGLRPSTPTIASVPPPAVSPPPEPEPTPSPSPSPTFPVDPRTQLLTDMARAFQMGMGLDDGTGSGSRSSSSPVPSPPPPSSSSSPSPAIEVNLTDGQQRQQQQRPPPPEDSFERFLLDLQVDLRRTLEEGQPDNEPQPDRERQAEPVDVPPSIYPREAPLSTNDQAASDFGEEFPALPPDDDDDDESLSYQDEADGDGRGPEASSPSEPPQTPARRTVAGSERRPGGINWWRMYRFPPMVVPHGTPATSPWPPSPSSPPPSSPSPTIPPVASAPAPGATRGERGAADTQALPSDGNTVVPVIVVGLQSVHGHGHGHGHRHTEGRDDHPSQQQQQPQDQGQDNDDGPGEAAESTRDRERERQWSARAAEAFRGLRPASGSGPASAPTRREGSGSSGNEGGARLGDDGHGSTTFFIYVIGGYYPPNHQLVVGTDPLDSFEELAELLGHVKPQTATREDIDNSGLEVIRSSVLAEYEKSGRIAPMCVDRCLICLEDYNTEEDLRLLTCRHVFHKECVDRWLETGRNNCPACRSQGVTTGSGPIPVPSSP